MDFRAQWAKDVGQTVAEAVAKCQDPILEPKYDGWRCIAIRTATGVEIYNPSRNSDPSKRYTGQLPELEADLMKLPVGTILDGELVRMSYDADAGRWDNDFYAIHTCMRTKDITKVAPSREGITYIVFDCPTGDIATQPLRVRRDYIQTLLTMHGLERVTLTSQMPATQAVHDDLVGLGFEGTVVKDQAKPYAFAKRGHGWFKVKNTRTIDCVVMEVVMDGKGQHAGKAGRMHVGQYQDGQLVRVASVNCLNDKQRAEATAHPERFEGEVIEVKIYGWDKDGPRHPTPLRFRKDKTPTECVWSKV
jgi:ATP-dependent DNA ligase